MSFKSKELENILNIKSSRIRVILKELVEDNLLISIGANKNRYYVLKADEN